MLRLANLMADQYNLQVEDFQIDFEALQANPELMAEYLHLNVTGLMAEAAEVAKTVGWKPWASDRGYIDKQALVDEACDVLAFLMNLLNVAGVNGNDLAIAWLDTLNKNQHRCASGYEQRKA